MSPVTSPSPSELRLDRMLTRYKAWADDLSYETAATLSLEELLKERQTTFKTIAHTLHHTYIVDDMFKAHIEGRRHGYTSRSLPVVPPIDVLREQVSEMNRWWMDLADGMADDALSAPVEFTFVNGDPGKMTRRDIILHVVQHATYHRGYVDDLMYQVPVIPPITDLTAFLQEAP